MKQIILATLCALAVLTSCKESKNNQGGTITFKRADISGAKFLTLAGGSDSKSTTETNTVYKIDENGNMTTVVFYIQIDQDGNKSIENVSEDIKVIPSYILDYGKGYMLFGSCQFIPITDKYRDFTYALSSLYSSFLVRKSDGAIFEIGQDQMIYFPYVPAEGIDLTTARKITYNSRGELYIVGDRDRRESFVSKLKVENEKLFLQQITTGVDVGMIALDKNDNLLVSSGYGYDNVNMFDFVGYIYSANGSVVALQGGYDRHLLLIDNEYYIIDHSTDSHYISIYTLQKISSLAPNIGFTEVATLTTNYNRSIVRLAVETESEVIFHGGATCFVYTKSTQKLSTVSLPDGFEKVRFNLQGIAYEYSEQNCTQITKYNIVDMTKKTINCDRGAVPAFIQTKTKVTSTDFFEFGVKNSNGAPIRVQTNLETGKVTVHEDADDRTIPELIRVS